LVSFLIPSGSIFAVPSFAARTELVSLIENVTAASAKRYRATDNRGHVLDCIKVIANPYVHGQFIGVYHTMAGDGKIRVNLAVSTNLMDWTWVKELAGSGTDNGAAMPTIKHSPDGGFVLAWEQNNFDPHIKISYYSNWNDLELDHPSEMFSCPRTLSKCAEGTPNIYYACSNYVELGFHYFSNCDVDRQARGALNFRTRRWITTKETTLDKAVLALGYSANIGDRDGYIRFKGSDFGLIEGQKVKNDFSTFRCFIYDPVTKNAELLNMHTDGNSTAFSNPTITRVNINGRSAIFVSMFIFAGHDPLGPLIYYRLIDCDQGTNSVRSTPKNASSVCCERYKGNSEISTIADIENTESKEK